MKFKNLIYAFLLITLVSCKKEFLEQLDAKADASTTTANSFRELSPEANFDWATQKDVSVSILGLTTKVPINRTLKITSLDESAVYYSSLYLMAASSVIHIKVPSAVSDIKVTYGAIEKSVKIASGKSVFNFMPDVVDVTAPAQ
jgi:hypothetical protein